MPLVSGRVLGCWTYDQQLAVSDPGCCSVKSNPGQVVLHTRASVTKQCKIWYRRKLGRSGVTLAMHHRHSCLSIYMLNNLRQGGEPPSCAPLGPDTLYLYLWLLLWGLQQVPCSIMGHQVLLFNPWRHRPLSGPKHRPQ